MNKQQLDRVVSIVLNVSEDELQIPKDISNIALEAHASGVQSPVYVDSASQVRNVLAAKFQKGNLNVDDTMLELAVENFLECAHMTSATATKLVARTDIGSAMETHGVQGGKISLENFDSSYDVSLAAVNAAFNIYRNYGQDLRREVAKVFPSEDIGTKAGYSVPIDRPFAHFNSFHTNGTAKDFDEVRMVNLLDSPHEFGSLVIYPDADNCLPEFLMDPTKVAPWAVLSMEEDTYNTLPYVFGKEVDLKGAALTNERKANGGFDSSDELSSAIIVDSIYLDFGGEIITIDTGSRPTAHMDLSRQGSENDYTLSTSEQFTLTAATQQLSGAPLTTVAIAAGARAVINVKLTGYSNLRTSFTSVTLLAVELVTIIDANNNTIPSTDPLYATMQGELDAWKTAGANNGFTIDARLQNSNLRSEGPILDAVEHTENYLAKAGNPVSVVRPVNREQVIDAVNKIATYNQIMKTRAALEVLEKVSTEMARITDNGTLPPAMSPVALGAGRHVLNTAFAAEVIDFDADLNSVSHKDRPEEMAVLVIGKLNAMANKLWVDGGYPAAVAGLPAGAATKPIITITTSSEYAAILKVFKSRFDAGFKWEIAGFPSKRVDDIAYMTIKFTKTGYHLLNFGVAIEGKENVFSSTVTRKGSTRKTLTSHPVSTPHVNAPVIGVVAFANRSNGYSKVCC